MSKASGSRRKRQRKGRDDSGRFQPGFSGNPNGRPPKQPQVPKVLGEQLADKLWEKVARVDAAGKTRMVSAYDLIIERFIESIPNAKPKEIMAMLKWMEQLEVFDYMRAKAIDPDINLFEQPHSEWFRSKRVMQALSEHFEKARVDSVMRSANVKSGRRRESAASDPGNKSSP